MQAFVASIPACQSFAAKRNKSTATPLTCTHSSNAFCATWSTFTWPYLAFSFGKATQMPTASSSDHWTGLRSVSQVQDSHGYTLHFTHLHTMLTLTRSILLPSVILQRLQPRPLYLYCLWDIEPMGIDEADP